MIPSLIIIMAPRISLPLERIKDHYDVVVVGSGYGGGVAASRLARAGRSVCVLERGEERQPGEYPNTLPEAAAQLQAQTPEGSIGPATGLFDFHVHPDINVLVGCGLGGTSLINANVSLRPDPRVFEDSRWPAALRDDIAGFSEGARRAEEMLRPQPYPDSWPALAKLDAQMHAAAALNQPVSRTPINVTFEDGLNHVGVEQHKCSLCGDCVSGCNYGAKNTTLMNYLPDARNHGADIFTGARVQYVERRGGRWLVQYQPVDAFRTRFDAPLAFVSADVVVLAAGTLGSTEVLLRSRARGLPLSDQLGQRFSGNGDVLAFAYDTKAPMNGIGSGHRDPASMPPVGPCITTVIDLRNTPEVDQGLIVEDGSIPGALGPILGATFLAASGTRTLHGTLGQLAARAELELQSFVHGSHAGALAHTQTFLVMGHDNAEGHLSLEDDRLHIAWPGVGEQPAIEAANVELARVAEALGGVFVKNPIWSDLLRHSIVTVHPLGGCPMGDGAETGVVNDKSQVFAGTSGTDVHDGLYVCDGAVIPLALGVNPLITISALAERSVALLAHDRGWRIDYSLPSAPGAAPVAQKTSLQFTERMTGFFSTAVTTDYAAGEARGKADGSTCEFVLTIVSEDLDQMLSDPTHPAGIYGTVTAPELSPDPMEVTSGLFNLFVENPDQAEVRNMRYRLTLHTTDGRELFFDGHKTIQPASIFKIWPATSTLYVTVFDGGSDASPVLGRGILHIRLTDFATQMTTMDVRNAPSMTARLEGLARFGKLFAGTLWHTYGGVASALFSHDEPPPARKKRPLGAPAPEVHGVRADDGAELRLVRFNGGRKGPIIAAPGFSNSTEAFMFDGLETTFAEFFAAHGYDVWLFDYRASPALPVSRTQFTLDDVARRDWPAAVAFVRQATGAKDVQIVGHCVGSLTTYMALLSGLTGVRQFVSSQLTPHIDVEIADKLKAGIHLDEVMRLIGLSGVDTGNATSPTLAHIDQLLALYPMPADWRALGGVARRIFAIYGHVLAPANLNPATAAALGEIFGFGNLTAFSQITELLREGHLVDHDGRDVYLPQVGRLKLPIAIIHGADNVFFYPRGSERTYDWLCENNGPALYTRHVLPGYAHLDCFIGTNAARDVYPTILAELDKGN